MGFNVETVTYRNIKFNVWVRLGSQRQLFRVIVSDTFEYATDHCACATSQDVGGQDKIRPLWRHYYTGTQGLVFVIDSTDTDRIGEAKEELQRILSDREMKDCLLLVFANKQDLPEALSPQQVTDQLELAKMKDRTWYVHPSNALAGDGLFGKSPPL